MMESLKNILFLVEKDIRLEWRQKYALYGILLYLCSAIFAIYVLHEDPEPEVWNSLYWLILLFISVIAVAKSFLQDSTARNLYYFTVHHPRDIILSKLLYNALLMGLMSLVSIALFMILLGNPVQSPWRFIGIALSGGISLSMLFTLLSAIASKTGGHSALIAILGFPLVIPQLILLGDLSKPLFMNLAVSGWWSFFGILILLNVLIILLSVILFPFVWKD